MRRRIGAAQAAATRPLSALIGAALLLLTVVAGVGGLAALGGPAGPSRTTVAAAAGISTPVVGDRRAAPALGAAAKPQHATGWAPHHPEPATVPGAGWQQPAGLVDATVDAAPAVIALTIQVSHRGRAPPAGSLST